MKNRLRNHWGYEDERNHWGYEDERNHWGYGDERYSPAEVGAGGAVWAAPAGREAGVDLRRVMSPGVLVDPLP